MRCRQCGFANPDGMRFCGQCGSPLALQEQPPPAASPAPGPRPPASADAERRQLTVLFCDLIGSTALSERLDPEELREIVRAYQQVSAEAIERYEGHIAQYLGDGLLVYFGYPQAQEDAAQRAVRAALAIAAAMPPLNDRFRTPERLAVRIGIHTGLVVVGEVGGGSRREQLALGETPNLAARLQGLATPDQVVVSAETHRLIRGFFDTQPLGPVIVKGISRPVEVFAVVGESAVQGRLDADGLTPMVGRRDEIELLWHCWEQARGGAGTVAAISGEAGIGKSRLVRAAREHLSAGDEPLLRVELRCLPYHQDSALYPVIDSIQRTLAFRPTDGPEERLTRLVAAYRDDGRPELVPLIAALLSLPHPGDYPELTYTPDMQRRKTLEGIVARLVGQARRQPVLLIVEDLHWADPSTLELLGMTVREVAGARILMLLTFRPDFSLPWPSVPHIQLPLERLVQDEVADLVARVTGGRALPAEVLTQIVARTDGVPLFVEELTKLVLESGLLQEADGRYALVGSLSPLGIPATLHDSLMARLDRLGAAKEVAQLGAVLEREFPYALLAAVAPQDGPTLERALARLVAAGLLQVQGTPPEATYRFAHALIQEEAYQSLLRSARREHHQRVAVALEENFRETVDTQPEVLAHHYTEAGITDRAITLWQRASRRAVARSAHEEAIHHLTRARTLLQSTPDGPQRAQQELRIQVPLAQALMTTRGYDAPETGEAFQRALDLSQEMEPTPLMFEALMGLEAFYGAQSEYARAEQLAYRCLRMAEQVNDPTLLLWAEHAVGAALFTDGDFLAGREHCERALALYDPARHRPRRFSSMPDPGALTLAWLANITWSLGYPDQALAHARQARQLVEEPLLPFPLADALATMAGIHTRRGEARAARETAERVITLASEQGFAFHAALGTKVLGLALILEGRLEEGIARLEEGLGAATVAGGTFLFCYFTLLLADAYGQAGRLAEGLSRWTDVEARIARTGEGHTLALLHEVRGGLAQAGGDPVEAQRAYRAAIAVARRQHACSFELRAAIRLARLLQGLGRVDEAGALLGECYAWFTEGFGTADLRAARALLDELRPRTRAGGR